MVSSADGGTSSGSWWDLRDEALQEALSQWALTDNDRPSPSPLRRWTVLGHCVFLLGYAVSLLAEGNGVN